MNYTFRHLQAMLSVAHLGSYTSAAEDLHMTRSGLSQTIKELENQLGFALFTRTTRRVSLTDEGSTFLPHAERVVAEYQSSLWVAKNVSRRAEGVLRVASSQLMASTFLPDIMVEFCKRYPRMDVQIVDVSHEKVAEAVLAGKADLGIGPERPLPDKMSATVLVSIPIACLCSSQHAFAALDEVTWKQFAEQKIISADRAALVMLMRDIGYTEQLAPSIEVNHLLTILALLSRNVGVMTCMRHVEPLLKMYDLRMVPLVQPEVERRLVIMTASPRRLSPPAEAFFTLAREMVPQAAFASTAIGARVQPESAKAGAAHS